MSWLEDGAPCKYFGAELTPCLRGVGWLERGKPFTSGPLDERIHGKMKGMREELLNARLGWLLKLMYLGRHYCDFCSGQNAAWGSLNFLIPGRDFLFVAPELILHYMVVHAYRPPEEFCQAVLDCPPVPSTEYLEAVSANGGDVLLATGTGLL